MALRTSLLPVLLWFGSACGNSVQPLSDAGSHDVATSDTTSDASDAPTLRDVASDDDTVEGFADVPSVHDATDVAPDRSCESASDAGTNDAGGDGGVRVPMQHRESVEGCASDAGSCSTPCDCPMGNTCACEGSPYVGDAGNVCVGGNCVVDADCGPGGYCSPSMSEGGACARFVGFFCHTSGDECVDDTECPSPGSCIFSATHWACTRAFCD
jgi:hypothetical protein